jgi:uncharacterized protein (TIGR02246 family)
MRTLVRHTTRVLSLWAVVAFSGCASQDGGNQADATRAVEDIWKEYSASLNAGDLERWLALWTDDGIQMPPGEPAVAGKERIRTRNGGFLDQFKFDMGITNEEVRVAGDWAFARGTYEASLIPKQGGAPVPINGKYMTILARQGDGSWKIHRDIFNSNVAGK